MNHAGIETADDQDGVTPLMRAVRDGESQALRSLLKEGAEVNAQDSNGWSALTYAARRGDAVMIAALANKGAELNHASDEGWTPLMYAANEGYANAVRILVERRADVNAVSKSGATALTLAEQRSRSWADYSAQSPKGPAQSLTEQRDYAEVLGLLKQAGAVASAPGSVLLLSPPVDSKPVILNHIQPRYTEEARQHRIKARIYLRVLVGEDGAVKKVRVLAGAPYGLTEQAVIAANELKFKPASRAGKPVEIWLPMSMDFNLR